MRTAKRFRCTLAPLMILLSAAPAWGAFSDPEEMLAIGWGPYWYVRGRTYLDDNTQTEGAARHSAFLVVRNLVNRTSDWVLIEGARLELTPQGFPARIATTQPGHYARSTPTDIAPAAEFNAKSLTQRLVDVYARTKHQPDPALHCPFFLGPGWHLNMASARDAKAVLDALELTLDGTWPTSALARVVAQNTPAGKHLHKGDKVSLVFNDVIEHKSGCPGDLRTDPIPLQAVAGMPDTFAASADISAECKDEGDFACGGRTGLADVYFGVPAEAKAGDRVRVRQTLFTASVYLSAHTLQKGVLTPIQCVTPAGACCADADGEFIEFVVPAGDVRLVVEPASGPICEPQIELKIVSRAPAPASAPALQGAAGR